MSILLSSENTCFKILIATSLSKVLFKKIEKHSPNQLVTPGISVFFYLLGLLGMASAVP